MIGSTAGTMNHNWSWLPPRRRATTPPPLRPSPEQLDSVDIFEEAGGGSNRPTLYYYYRPFPHDNLENESLHSSTPVDHPDEVMTDPDQAIDDPGDDETTHAGGEPGDRDDGDVTAGEEEEAEEGGEGVEEDVQEEEEEEEPAFDPASVGLKEISNLASFTVSSYKPGCGVKELRDDDVTQFWQ